MHSFSSRLIPVISPPPFVPSLHCPILSSLSLTPFLLPYLFQDPLSIRLSLCLRPSLSSSTSWRKSNRRPAQATAPAATSPSAGSSTRPTRPLWKSHSQDLTADSYSCRSPAPPSPTPHRPSSPPTCHRPHPTTSAITVTGSTMQRFGRSRLYCLHGVPPPSSRRGRRDRRDGGLWEPAASVASGTPTAAAGVGSTAWISGAP